MPAPELLRQGIGGLVFNFLLPVLTFSVLAIAPFGIDLITVPVTSIVTVLGSYAIAWVVFTKLMARDLPAPTRGSLIVASVWCNCTYLGLPIVTGVIGNHVSRVPIVFDLLGMSPMLFTLGAALSMRYGQTQQRPGMISGLRHVITRPPFIAAVLGLLVNAANVPIHPAAMQAMAYAGGAVAPLMMISVGLGMTMPRWSSLPVLAPAVIIKLVVAPVIAYAVAAPLIPEGDVFRATMLEAAMPTMMLTMVFADRYGLDADVLSQAIVISTVASMLTLPFLAGIV